MKSTQLEIDLATEKFNFSAIENLDEITSIRFVNYSNKIEIPLAINDYPKITILKFIGKSGSDVFEAPDNLDQFINIKVLIIWNFHGFAGMKPMLLLEEFHTIVEDVQKVTREIITLFPNLKRLLMSGPYNGLKNQKLPNEIGSLSLLEELYLLSLGLIMLPNSFGNLKQLRNLVLKGNTLNGFPEAITQLENLETLEINQKFSKLPDSLASLKKLKKLHLNTDTSQSSSGERKIKQTPIPAVVGKLENIEDLDIGLVDLFDIKPILSLKKLKKLSLRNSALKNCDGFSNFSVLEELNFEKSIYLRNLDGLKGLPIKSLNLSSTFIEFVDAISSLELLETLDISRCYRVQDFTPVLVHPAIKELNADDEVMKNWNEKDKKSEPISINNIITQLATDNLQEFEETILKLSEYIDANSIRSKNPLAGYFNIKTIDEKITSIEVLDSGIKKHLKNLSDKTLVAIFGMTFKSVNYDNYNAALIVLEEIIARQQTETQKQIVDQFYNACEYYDAGHRFWGHTVHDQLIDTLFPQFTSEALYEVLKNASADMLNIEGGDEMETLFIPALKNTSDLELQNKILDVFFSYEEEGSDYFSSGYFKELLQQIKEIASPDLLELILQKEKNAGKV